MLSLKGRKKVSNRIAKSLPRSEVSGSIPVPAPDFGQVTTCICLLFWAKTKRAFSLLSLAFFDRGCVFSDRVIHPWVGLVSLRRDC